jgi:hypothetical protein
MAAEHKGSPSAIQAADRTFERTAIHIAAKEGHTKAIRFLYMVGDDVVKSKPNLSIMFQAC